MERAKKGEDEVYVRIDSADAVESKKDLLMVTASIINLQKIHGSLISMGKSEVRERTQVKSEIKGMQVVLKKMLEDLPAVPAHRSDILQVLHEEPSKMFLPKERHHAEKKEPSAKVKSPKIKAVKQGRQSPLDQELLDIKRRLANLS